MTTHDPAGTPSPDQPDEAPAAGVTDPTATDDETSAPCDGSDTDSGASASPVYKRIQDELRRANARIVGRLTLHYRARDVAVAMDGASAMRIIATWQGRRNVEPQLDPKWSTARWEWIGIDLDELMGCHWEPDPDHTDQDRVTVDPQG